MSEEQFSLQNRSVNKCRRVNFGLLCAKSSEVEHSVIGYSKTQFICISIRYMNNHALTLKWKINTEKQIGETCELIYGQDMSCILYIVH